MMIKVIHTIWYTLSLYDKEGNVKSMKRNNVDHETSQSEPGNESYDYQARRYDPALARFTTIDPLAEKHPDISPYAYSADNPINAVDPDGKKVKPNGQDEYNMILGTLPQETRSFVVFDDQGFIDKNGVICKSPWIKVDMVALFLPQDVAQL